MQDSILTSFQAAFLKDFFESESGKYFFLTGGTALAEYYLKHRFSEDLDFFTLEKETLINIEARISPLLKKQNASIASTRKLGAYNEFIISCEGENTKLDFMQDIKVQFGQKKTFGNIIADSIENIASNKVCAILGRTEIKDFIDLYFILNELNMDFDAIFAMAKQKDSGLNEFYFAGTLLEIKNLKILPRMIKEIDIVDLNNYFLALADRLFDKAKPSK